MRTLRACDDFLALYRPTACQLAKRDERLTLMSPKCPRDPNALAKSIVDIATG